MHTLKVTLKQHTPLIHFQHDQDGATLRASEVKPKLDRFMLTKLGNGNYQEGVELAKANGWLVGKGEHPALDYKMRIEAAEVEELIINEQRKYTEQHENDHKPYIQHGDDKYLARIRKSDGRKICDLKQYPLFFANLDADYYNPNEYRKFSYTEAPLVMVLSAKSDSLYSFIANANLLNDFFFQTNFGTRQSKGFGSFTIDVADTMYQERFAKYRFTLNVENWWKNNEVRYIDDEFERVFRYIDWFYKTLRGGINIKKRDRTVFYFKSLAYKYADEYLNAKWDKRKIKEEFYNIDRETREHTYDVRDMLGYSTNEQWLSYRDSIEKKIAIFDERTQQYRQPLPQDNLPIERMRSPLLFKPIFNEDEGIYTINIILQDDLVNMEGFKSGKKICVFSKKKNNNFMIEIPRDFSSESFFDFIFKTSGFDITEHVDSSYHNYRERQDVVFDVLENIYSQIKDNL